MKKFKVCDNATFAFQHTLDNLKEFLTLKKQMMYVLLASVILLAMSLIVMGKPIYYAMQDDVISAIELTEEKNALKLSKSFVVDEEEKVAIEEQLKVIDDKVELVLENMWSDVKRYKLNILLVISLSIVSSLIARIFTFEWLRFCFKSKYAPSFMKNIWFMIKIWFLSLLYILPVVLLATILNVFSFIVHPVVGVIALFAIWIPAVMYIFVTVCALNLRYSQIIVGLEKTSMLDLMKKCKGSALRFLTASFLVGMVISIVNWGVNILVAFPEELLGIVWVLVAGVLLCYLMFVVSNVVKFSLSYALYRAIVEEDDQFLLD